VSQTTETGSQSVLLDEYREPVLMVALPPAAGGVSTVEQERMLLTHPGK
jgi:hypothetical protein